MYGPLERAGEWWRIVSGAFLHGGLMHIAFNMFALWQVGTGCELLFRPLRMFAVYAIALVGSGLAIYCFSYDQVTVGASGAIFGLFGALAAGGLRIGPSQRALVQQLFGIIVINLILGFLLPNISNAGHIGGLVTGFIAGFVLFPQPHAIVSGAEDDFDGIDSHDPHAREADVQHESTFEPGHGPR